MRVSDGAESSRGAIVASVIRRVRFCGDMPCRFGLVSVVLHGVGRPRSAGTLILGRQTAREELPTTPGLAPGDSMVQAEPVTHPAARPCQGRW
jgi:hypothetical protein